MAAITLSVPDVLKKEMDAVDYINWSSVARSAFVERLKDIKELETIRKVREISEIAEDDNREVREELVQEVIRSTEDSIRKVKAGKVKPMTVDEFKKWCKEL
jgi:hypothetical protein